MHFRQMELFVVEQIEQLDAEHITTTGVTGGT
jgi:hypothetical protein